MLLPLTLPTLALVLMTFTLPISAADTPDHKQKPMIDTFRQSCVNWQMDPAACSLSGICKLTDDSREASHPKLHGWRETSLDLNNCIWYDAKESKVKWFEEDEDGKMKDLSGTANFCRDFCDCWMFGGGMSEDLMACICDSGEHKRNTWSSLNLTERIANWGGHFECFGRKGN